MTLPESSSRQSKKVIVTTSWDDGHVCDFRVADLLERYGLKGTFYISPASREIDPGSRLGAGQIELLGRRFELGAHTYSHPDLTAIPHRQAFSEISRGVSFLEAATGEKASSFCYPYGKYNRELARGLLGLGFTYARTVRQFETRVADPLTAGTAVHAYQHRTGLLRYLRATGFNPARAGHFLDWSAVAADLFDMCLRDGGVYHIWGHSWEIDEHGDWDRLERVFSYIAGRAQVEYVSNRSLGRSPRTSLLIASSYFPPKAGGLERYAFEMAKGAARDSMEVSVITSGTSKKITHEITEDGLALHRLPVQFKISDTPFGLRWFLDIRRLVRDINPDVVNVHLPVPFLADLVALSSRGAPVIVTYHSGSMKGRGPVLDFLIGLYEKLVLPLTLGKARRIICTSEHVRQGFLKRYAAKSVTINPGVDDSVFTKRARRPDNRSVIFVGDYRTGLKGLDYLREAVGLVPGATLHVVGRGAAVESPGTVYHGELHGKELVDRIRDSQALVLPSVNPSEAFGMVLLEAMACGVPVIGTDIGGISGVIRNGEDGLLVPPGDVKALAAAISYIINNPADAEQLADRAYEKVVTGYRWQGNIDRFIAQVSDVMTLKIPGGLPEAAVPAGESLAR